MSIKKAPKLFKNKCILNVSDYVAFQVFFIMKLTTVMFQGKLSLHRWWTSNFVYYKMKVNGWSSWMN